MHTRCGLRGPFKRDLDPKCPQRSCLTPRSLPQAFITKASLTDRRRIESTPLAAPNDHKHPPRR
jgi:hypothetical protein